MRLLNAKTLKLHSFIGCDIPPYAILSHRWGESEVTFQDLEKENGIDVARADPKILGCCTQALQEGLDYVWIDSCCIDKSSSAELSEAINSMFRWYQDAVVCYVYLSDVEREREGASNSTFQNSAWFTRGWTLQELLAPEAVIFFDQNWVELGTKTTLEDELRSITGITHLFDFSEACIAQKMSWAAKRKTTRIEDEAYCLMGIFGVNMPILYGEGEKAFHRLQEEIIKFSQDESIFAWRCCLTGQGFGPSGLLAKRPGDFADSGDIRLHAAKQVNNRSPYAMTNRGLQIQLGLVPAESAIIDNETNWRRVSDKRHKDQTFMASLNCVWATTRKRVAIPLRSIKGSDDFYRYTSRLLYSEKDEVSSSMRIIFVKEPPKLPFRGALWFSIDLQQTVLHGYSTTSLPAEHRSMSSHLTSWSSLDIAPLIRITDGFFVFLQFEKLETRFILWISVVNGRPGIEIYIPTSCDDIPRCSEGRPVDRVRKVLANGKVVTASLRKTPVGDEYPELIIPDGAHYKMRLAIID